VFPAVNYFSHSQLRECAILAPNNIVKNINDDILALLPAEVTEYISINTVVDPNDCVNCPTEFMISLEPASMPPHKLQLQVGTPVILLCNLDAPKLCNGTRLAMKRLMPNAIEQQY